MRNAADGRIFQQPDKNEMRELNGINILKIEGKSKEFYTLFILLSIFSLIGFICFM